MQKNNIEPPHLAERGRDYPQDRKKDHTPHPLRNPFHWLNGLNFTEPPMAG
jgi:hypothetical protein